ncbi:ATP-binding cassette domain-containing protein [Hydrogenophaga sp. 5NK40-0174]|uniref:ATP-binding cassette domain-containing protein n=1 Tax=Hydrogenophaga sp. 5NK40-0174 TaxID=3127649 RepID=UPI00310AA8FE
MTLQVHIRHLGHDRQALVKNVHFEVPPGHVLTLMGPSGCGKSSVLSAIAGTLEAMSGDGRPLKFEGEVVLNGQHLDGLAPHRRGIGLLFQDPMLFGHMTVRENLLFAIPPGKSSEREAQVTAALETADLAEMGARDPATLSGGQRARVALMRALLAQPRALLLDEPFSRLDAHLRARFRALVFEHVRARNIPALLVTHDREDIAEPNRLLEMTHDG